MRLPTHLTVVRLAAVAATLALAAACVPSNPGGSTSSAPAAADGGDTAADAGGDSGGEAGGDTTATGATEIRIGTTADVLNYNPLVGNSRTDSWVTDLMYPKLMQMTAEGNKEPLVATDWSYSDDGLTASMTIRDDLQWSDGEPLTAEDVVFTIDAVKAEEIGVVAGLISAYESAEAVSDTEIEFTLSRPDGTFLTGIGFWMPIVPEHVFSQAPSVQEFANDANWVSAGPYVLTTVERGQRYVLERVEPYPFAPDGVPTMERVVFRVFPDVNTAVLALRNGELDLIANAIPPALAGSLEGVEGVALQEVPGLGWAHMQYNTKRPPMDRVEVRQALAHAVDYDAIREVVLQGQAVSSDSSVLTPTLEFWDDADIEEYPFDPERSRELLESAGFSDGDGDGLYDGLTLEMIFDQADPIVAGWSSLVQETAKAAGIDIQLAGLERNTYVARTADRDFDIYAGSWAIMDDAPSNLALAFSSGGFINYAQVEDAELDALIEQAQTALTREEALEPAQQAAQRIHEQVYDNVLYVQNFNFAHRDGLTDFVVQPSELLSIVNPQSLAQVQFEG